MSLFALTPLGFGEIIGALLMGILRDKFGYKASLKILLILSFEFDSKVTPFSA